MDFSDDEDETALHNVSNYHFVDEKDEPISFSELPVQWNDIMSLDDKRKQIFLRGATDNGLQNVYKQVMAWKFDLSLLKPEIFVLSKDNDWIKLQKPRKSFEDIIRTILVTVNCLHFLKKNPEISERSLWDQLLKVFSLYEPCPSVNDLVDHMDLISEAVKRDEVLAKSKFLATLLEGKLTRNKNFNKDVECAPKMGFIVDDVIDEVEEDESDEENDLFDTVCAICDNGGELLCCEGRCLRSFHATVEAGSESMCESLGLSSEEVKAMQNFFCKNCQYMQHQCFACGALGSSDKSSGTEVFACVSGTCGQFYHPHCVAKLISRDSDVDATELQERIAAGEPFTCPLHKCFVCKQGEDKMDPDLQFAVCRRCPKAYHRKCLPRKIAFEDLEDEDIIQRAWVDLIPNRILIYCLKHEIDDEIGTPERNHIKFPNDVQKKKKQGLKLPLSAQKVISSEGESFKRPVEKEKPLKGVEKKSSTVKQCDSLRKSEGSLVGQDVSNKRKAVDASRKLLKKLSYPKGAKPITGENKPSLGERLYDYMSQSTKPVKPGNEDTEDSEQEQMQAIKPAVEDPLDADSKKRIMDIMKDSVSSITLEDITRKRKIPSTHAYSSKYVIDKAITLGKVEGSVEALRAALLKLEKGCSIEDAKAVCEPRLLNQIIKWKDKLKVYLAPFLYGMRYTSFGRHFTQVDKLKAIVDRLHPYVQDGDMIVDFCCGANDFSCLMKEKLDEIGKKCSYKNYDYFQSKNNFHFEERDWFTVQPEELPPGSQLIMGLNPPFGVNAVLANKFIDHALQFKPKLLILIVPRETERLDKKNFPYDLVWEDDELLAGRAFYLPGSIDVNDKQMEDWNLSAPLLYLWSHPNWTAKYKLIAEQHGHLPRVQNALQEENHHEVPSSSFLVGNHDLGSETVMHVGDHVELNNESGELHDRGITANASNGGLSSDKEKEFHKGHGTGKSQTNEISRKKRHGKQKRARGSDNKSLEFGQNDLHSLPVHCPADPVGGRAPDDHSLGPLEKNARKEVQDGYQHFDQRTVSGSHFNVGYCRSFNDDAAGRYGFNNEEPYSSLAQRWPHASSSPRPDFGVRNSEDQYMGYRRESTDSLGYRSYMNEMDAREPDIRSYVRLYGKQDFDPSSQRSSYAVGQIPNYSTPYPAVGPVADSLQSRMSTSAMQRYAPRLDELNHSRVNTLGPETHSLVRSNLYNPPQPGHGMDSSGFAPGPYRPFSQHNSSGWLNE